MQVTRIYESPRVTLPYTDAQWAASAGAGPPGRRRLVAGDVRLTMGGEPTFVSVDDRDGAEWNTDALGPTKRGWPPSWCTACAPLRPGRLPALRPGQVVPGRAAAALGAVDLLARRRPALLARPEPVRRRARPPRYTAADAAGASSPR
jgi:hypothetical protein